MTTGVVAEDRHVSLAALVRGYSQTFTSTEETTDTKAGDASPTVSGAALWEVIDPAPQSDSEAAIYHFAKSVWHLPSVVAVTHSEDRNVHLLWTFIRKRDKALRKEIYARERALMDRFPVLVFNFNVAALDQGAVLTLLRDDRKGRIVMCRPEQR